jgi:ankyrin repeat protein
MYDEFKKKLNEMDISDVMFDINIRDDQNNYFLTYAVTLNEPNIVKLLLEKGAKIDIVDKYDRSILVIPITFSYFEVLNLLLEANKDNIGISIIDMKDKNMRIPLHYAIEIQNIKAVKILLENGSNPNVTDKDGYTPLHLAVKSRSIEICKLVMQYVSYVNSRYNTGETALHIACNLQLMDIIVLLIKYGINVNIQDYMHEITALHYSVLLNNKEMTTLLLNSGANPNLQDVYGNTALHYCVIENNFEIFLMLTESKLTKNIINFNTWNIDGELPLHLALKNNVDNIKNYLKIMLPKSNLSVQDNNGNTCLHYLIKLDIWKDYKPDIIKKRLDIFALNSNKQMSIDIINKKDYNEFISMVVDSYLYRLKSANELWYNEWENICAKDFAHVSAEDSDVLTQKIKGKITGSNYEGVCKNIISEKIVDLINKVRKNEISCYEKSYPTRKSYVCLNIIEGSKLDYCTFTGSTMDILIGLIFLLRKHKDACSVLTKNFANNKELCAFYKSIGIIMNTKCEFLNFEIVWVHQRLYLVEGFYEQFKKCLQNPKVKYIIVPIGIEMREGSHAGYLIYNVLTKEVERFEPHGSTTPPGLYYNPNLLDEILEARFKTIDDDIKYVRPLEYLPKIGFQLMDISENKKKKIGDPLGFCALWCIWYVDMRLTYRDFDRKKLVEILMKTVKSQNISFRNLIRNYGKYIIDMRDKILLNSQMDINDWLNDQYTDIQINTVMSQLNNEIELT